MFKEKTSFLKKIKEAFHPTPLRKRIVDSLIKLKMQLRRLEITSNQLEQRDKRLYGKCIEAYQAKNFQLAQIYANECAEIRKIVKITLLSQLALERVVLRLETLVEFGDLAHTMMPLVNVVGKVKNQLEDIMPSVSLKLSEVNENLEGIMLEIGEVSESHFDTQASSEEAQKILNEASMIAEQRMKERFPELPGIPTKETHV
ncbi:MAG: Snf7 family protein [Candidatus Bathyarchaeia archaeon]